VQRRRPPAARNDPALLADMYDDMLFRRMLKPSLTAAI
jgi:hypothetical protein